MKASLPVVARVCVSQDSCSRIESPSSLSPALEDNASHRPSRLDRVGKLRTPFLPPSARSSEGSPQEQMPKSAPLTLLFPYALTTSSSTIYCLLNKGNLFLLPLPPLGGGGGLSRRPDSPLQSPQMKRGDRSLLKMSYSCLLDLHSLKPACPLDTPLY